MNRLYHRFAKAIGFFGLPMLLFLGIIAPRAFAQSASVDPQLAYYQISSLKGREGVNDAQRILLDIEGIKVRYYDYLNNRIVIGSDYLVDEDIVKPFSNGFMVKKITPLEVQSVVSDVYVYKLLRQPKSYWAAKQTNKDEFLASYPNLASDNKEIPLLTAENIKLLRAWMAQYPNLLSNCIN